MNRLTLVPVFVAFGAFSTLTALAQDRPMTDNGPAHVTAATGPTKLLADGFSRLPSGLEYKVIKHGTGTTHAGMGDHIEMHIHVQVNDSTMFDSRKMNNNKPVPFQVQMPNFKGDPIEGFMLLVAGDSAVMRLPVDSISKQGKQLMPGMKEGDRLNYQVSLISVMTDADFKKDQATKSEMQKAIDESMLAEYFKKNNIKAKRTASGLYYTVSKPGTGAMAKQGQSVSVNYTGKLLGSNKAFDSNTDSEFHHVEPFTLALGTGSVIKGWDEGLAIMNKGEKATLYIPSALAYGSQDKAPQIPANSILVFDVEVTKISTKEELEKETGKEGAKQLAIDDKLIKDYLDKKKIKATKTKSGMYYVITKKGTGDLAKNGEKVLVKYNGTFLDGNKFDGNMDKPDPFTFSLGQGMVIKGWDEGIALLNKGAKATLFIPSGIAYGAQARGPIPANAVLLFDVELVDIQK